MKLTRRHEELAPFYREAPERLRLVEIQDADHMMPAADWERSMLTTVEWLVRFLDE